MSDTAKIDALIAGTGLTMASVFVPYSKSRNANRELLAALAAHKLVKREWLDRLTINWRVTLKDAARPGRQYETDYQQGIGHLPKGPWTPGSREENSAMGVEALMNTLEHGRAHRVGPGSSISFGGQKLTPPHIRDVLYCLIADAEAIDYAGFDDWAETLGYDTDSRKAEAIYDACMKTALALRALIGDATITALREAYRDY